MLRTVELPPRAQERLYTINEQAQRAADLIQQILDFSRQSVLERQVLDLLPFTKELIKLLERTLPENINIALVFQDEAFLIRADPSRIQQMIMNLAVNARDAMPDGGLLRLTLAHQITDKTLPMQIRDLPPGSWVRIDVSDSGSGILPEAQAHIFEPFFTTKEVGQGTGLGLSQVLGIIQQHDGCIFVKTSMGEGTTFSIYFPTYNLGERPAPHTDQISLQLGRRQTVLLVEDHSATRQALVESLVLLNYEVIEAVNGRDALTILKTIPDDIDVVVSDVVMPEMGGVALLHAIRELELAIPVLFLTGHPLNNEIQDLPPHGIAGWLLKPPTLLALSHLLSQALGN